MLRSSPRASHSLNVVQTAPTDWKYVNEGGATIVFAYTGPPHPIFTGNVLRLRKIALGQGGLGSPNEPEDPTIAFQNQVIARLVPLTSLPNLQTVHVSREWLESLAQVAHQARPVTRQNKDIIDTSRSKGVLGTNLIAVSGISVEIKPKWGFLPNPKHLSTDSLTIKSQHCRYCMHTSMRSASGESPANGYCPLDLFSPQETRIRKAVTALWESWIESDASTNNLRIFVDGIRVHPMPECISNIATHLNCTDSPPAEAFITALTQALRGDPLLRTLQGLQRRLDALDIEGLLKVTKVHSKESAQGSSEKPFASVGSFQDPTSNDWIEFTERFLKPKSPPPDDSSNIQDLQFQLMSYLLSATFKDCSIIAKFEPWSLRARLYIIDLDPKAISRLDKWLVQDREIVQAFRLRLQRELDLSVCIDDNL